MLLRWRAGQETADLSNLFVFLCVYLQLQAFQEGNISPYSADLAIELLRNATNTTAPLYGGDVRMTLEFAKVVLQYENRQSGLGLISQQYRDFVQVRTNSAGMLCWLRTSNLFRGEAINSAVQ